MVFFEVSSGVFVFRSSLAWCFPGVRRLVLPQKSQFQGTGQRVRQGMLRDVAKAEPFRLVLL